MTYSQNDNCLGVKYKPNSVGQTLGTQNILGDQSPSLLSSTPNDATLDSIPEIQEDPIEADVLGEDPCLPRDVPQTTTDDSPIGDTSNTTLSSASFASNSEVVPVQGENETGTSLFIHFVQPLNAFCTAGGLLKY